MRFFLIHFFILSSLYAYPSCSAELKSSLEAIYFFPPGRQLLEEVERQGPVWIYCASFSGNSRAMWIADKRSIIVNSRFFPSFADGIRSILFELYNAKQNQRFLHVDNLARNHQISKEEYIERVEYLEHQNALAVSKLIECGIEKGYFPPQSRWLIAKDFKRHFSIQKRSGHSDAVAGFYDSMMRRYYKDFYRYMG